eukprot:NODE_3997_length_879_cov_125.681928_g3685_i0.p1 GENE.NODE_3997_length_879_cov_125.681928_g3685_i0~~NODE_3997_length_879_cov_125.681928_g3685_i0.p1  ORF type:complete len:115 (+),score=21.57 NODE_3997_length_879_cov_125.681928_g3685_i0:64-408(+)
MANLPLFLALLSVMVLGVTSKQCRPMGRDTWGHDQGTFEKEGPHSLKWTEYDNERRVKSTFTQTIDNGQQVVLNDAARGVSIVLQDGIAGINHDGGSQYQQLYKGKFVQGYDCT